MRSDFDYLRPASAEEAIAAKERLGGEAMYWAGGTDAILDWQREFKRPSHCIDITRIQSLKGIEVAGDRITLGAAASLADLERSGGQHPFLARLAEVSKLMCTPGTRSIGTVGGNLCNASPAADLTPALMALDAEVVVLGSAGERRLPLERFFAGPKRTVLTGPELLTRIEIPLRDGLRTAICYRRIDRTIVDIALVCAGVSLCVDAERLVRQARVALGAVGPVVFRSTATEERLTGIPLDRLDSAVREEAGRLASADAKPIDDVRASAEYRSDMIAVMTRRALAECVVELEGA